MPIVLARYSEIGLKSTPVRVKFENRLRDNIMSMLASERLEALVTKRDARFFIESSDVEATASALRRVFGIASVSIAEACASDMESICATAAEYSMDRISEGQSFAVKARREGTNHPFTSVDVGREAGSAIFLANEHKGVKVDLTNPDVIFYIEVRNNRTFVFGSYIRCHGGLPVGTQGKVLAEVKDDRGVLSAWLMMKRGCKVFVKGNEQPLLEKYDPDLKYIKGDDIPSEVLGIVKGVSFSELQNTEISSTNLPIYFPTIAMSDDEVSVLIKTIKEESNVP